MENISSETACPTCHASTSATENFCSQCGTKLTEPPLSTSAARQIFIYIISFIFAPLGLVYAFKYLKQSNPKARRIGIIVIILTILAIALMIWVTKAFTNWQYQLIDTF